MNVHPTLVSQYRQHEANTRLIYVVIIIQETTRFEASGFLKGMLGLIKNIFAFNDVTFPT